MAFHTSGYSVAVEDVLMSLSPKFERFCRMNCVDVSVFDPQFDRPADKFLFPLVLDCFLVKKKT